jgi:predicted deacylase
MLSVDDLRLGPLRKQAEAANVACECTCGCATVNFSFTGIEETGDAAVDARSRAMAAAYGLRYLLIGPSPGTTTTAAAALGIPAVLGEVGGQGRWPWEDVALHAAGFRRVLRAAGLIDWAPTKPRFRPGPGLPQSTASFSTLPPRNRGGRG